VRSSLRTKLGAAIMDWPRFEIGLRNDWTRIRNRQERLEVSPDGLGVACRWQWTSDLHVAKVFPSLAARLMHRALEDWPICFADAPSGDAARVQVSFVIGHRGMQRAPQLLATLATIAAQRAIRCECIVVEQSSVAEIRDQLPHWVRYLHTPLPAPDMPYCRSWTLNAGARLAKGRVLVLHDNDMLVPEAYAEQVWRRYEAGFEVVNLKRFIFYFSEGASKQIQAAHRLKPRAAPTAVVQNAEAGGSLAVERDAYFALGGYDESFVGWGGEDNEFWERAQTRRVWPYAYLPIVHLWHSAQARKEDRDNPTLRRHAERSSVPPEVRIGELAARPFGDPANLSVD
jgi:hypothetical protein